MSTVNKAAILTVLAARKSMAHTKSTIYLTHLYNPNKYESDDKYLRWIIKWEDRYKHYVVYENNTRSFTIDNEILDMIQAGIDAQTELLKKENPIIETT